MIVPGNGGGDVATHGWYGWVRKGLEQVRNALLLFGQRGSERRQARLQPVVPTLLPGAAAQNSEGSVFEAKGKTCCTMGENAPSLSPSDAISDYRLFR